MRDEQTQKSDLNHPGSSQQAPNAAGRVIPELRKETVCPDSGGSGGGGGSVKPDKGL